MIFLKFADMKRLIKGKMIQRLEDYFITSKFIESNSKFIGTAARKVSQRNFYTIQRVFQKNVDQSENIYLQRLSAQQEFKRIVAGLENVERRRLALAKELSSIKID
jgi:hypothetical protein